MQNHKECKQCVWEYVYTNGDALASNTEPQVYKLLVATWNSRDLEQEISLILQSS